MEGKSLLASLPSSLDFRPSISHGEHGCVEIPEASFNCYVLKAGRLLRTISGPFPEIPMFIGNR